MIDLGTIGVKVKADGTEEAAKKLQTVGEKTQTLKDNVSALDKKMEENNSSYRAQASMIKAHTDTLNKNLQKRKEEQARIELLSKNIKLQTDKVENLKNQLEELIKTEGENSDAAREMRIEINNATAELGDMTAAAKGAANEKIASGFEKIKTGIKAVCTAAVAAGTAIVGALTAAAESTREYREDQAKLITTFEKGGFSASAAKKSYADMFAILGEDDRSVEAVNHLAKLCDTEEQLAYWADICAGVSAEFGDSLPIEGLTEAANETAKVGAVTGPLADALNWAGINEDAFNESLEKCNGEKERAALITETLNNLYSDSAQKYKEMNKDIIANRDAQREMQDATAKVGAVMEPIIAQGKKIIAEVLTRLADWIDKNKGKINDFVKKIKSFIDFLIKNRRTVIAVIAGIGTAFAAWKAAKVIAGVVNALTLMKKALNAATAAQKALNVAQASTPLGMIAALLGLVVGGLCAYCSASDDAEEKTSELSEKLKEQRDNWDNLKESTKENISSGLSQLEHIKTLKDELISLADETGRVKDCDKARAEFILGELNKALGTEYTLTGNIINRYGELCDSIDAVILKKQAMTILESLDEDYSTATANIDKTASTIASLHSDISNNEDKLSKAQDKIIDELKNTRMFHDKTNEELRNLMNTMFDDGKDYSIENLPQQLQGRKELIDAIERAAEAQKELNQLSPDLTEAQKQYAEYSKTIEQYEGYNALFIEGKTDEIINDYKRRESGLKSAGDATYRELFNQAEQQKLIYENLLEKAVNGEDIDARILEAARWNAEYAFTQYTAVGGSCGEGFAKGVLEGFDSTKESITDFATRTLTAFRTVFQINSPSRKMLPLGKGLVEGIWKGMNDKTTWLIKKIKSFCDDSLSAIKNFFGINSPSRKTAEMGRYLMDGLAKGIDENTKPEEVLAKKCSNISSILSEFTTDFNLDASTADSEFNYWKLLNPNVAEEEIKARQIESINRKMAAQLNIIEATAQALGKTREVAGEATTEYKKLYEQLLKEKIAYEELKKSIDEVTSSQKKNTEEEYKAYKSRHEFLKSINYNKKQMREYEENTKRAWNYGGKKTSIVQNFYTKTATPAEVRAATYKANKECEVVECLS